MAYEMKECVTCKTWYAPTRANQLYCSRFCWRKDQYKHRKNGGIGPVDCVCKICGKKYQGQRNSFYCSKVCAAAGKKLRDEARNKKSFESRKYKKVPPMSQANKAVRLEEIRRERAGEQLHKVFNLGWGY